MNAVARIFDASAVLAILFEEAGCQAARDLLPGSSISAVNAAEVLAKLIQKRVPQKAALEALHSLDLLILPFGAQECAQTLDYLRPQLSLGDRACLATADVHKTDAVTAERSWAKLGISLNIVAIR